MLPKIPICSHCISRQVHYPCAAGSLAELSIRQWLFCRRRQFALGIYFAVVIHMCLYSRICYYYACFIMFYLPYLSSIHEEANCIAILWTGSPHSLGSCLFRGLWATCLPHKGGGIPLSALPKDTTSKLAGLFSTTSHKCQAPSREAIDTIF